MLDETATAAIQLKHLTRGGIGLSRCVVATSSRRPPMLAVALRRPRAA
jgi:hypothetical protein